MSFHVIYEAEAQTEFREAVLQYEEQWEGRGIRFVREVDAVIEAIFTSPLRFPRAGRHARKARVLGWPYSIYFAINEAHEEIKVVAVWHGKRNPAKLRQRLK